MLFVTGVLQGLTAFFISSIFKRGIYFFLIFFACIILKIEILSLLKAINGVNILLFTVFEFFCALLFRIKFKKPLLKIDCKSFLNNLKTAFGEDKILLFLSLGFAVFILSSFILSCFSPVTEADAAGYHCLRVLYWIKDGYISHFETADARAVCMPFNSEIFYTWLISLSKKDTAFGLFQFFSFLLLIISGYKIMELAGVEFKKRLWAILIFSSFPAVIIQSSSAQTDIVTGSLILTSIYLIFKYTKNPSTDLIFFSSLASALSFGVKTTALMVFIPVFCLFIFLLKKDILKFILFFILNFLIFSSYSYILNFIDYRNFLSCDSFILYNKLTGGIKAFFANIIRYAAQFFDFSGIEAANALNGIFLNTRDGILKLFSIPLETGQIDGLYQINTRFNEQSGGFGILGFLVFIPCVVMGFFKKNLRIFSVVFILSFLILCLLMSYTIYGIRYILCFVSISFPVLCLSYVRKSGPIKILIALIAFLYFIFASFYSPNRPLLPLLKEFKKTYSINIIQNKMRDYKFTFLNTYLFDETAAYKENIEPYCKDGNNIALFVSNSAMVYSAKYLELTNDCKIETLNGLNIEKYDLERYKLIIKDRNYYQSIDNINKQSADSPLINSDKGFCKYILKREINKPLWAQCLVYNDYLSKLGFNKEKDLEFLQNFGGGNIKRQMEVWIK